MAQDEPPESGTLVIAALLILALTFAGYWIFNYVRPGGDPWRLAPWFGIAAAVIIVVGIVSVVLPRREKDGK
ncbi:MAG: hypothetical protein H6Q33_5101 [Deltaproteobacteria bacterium]|jgi:ABC-type multidrug transport system permease subunit|nr:hypothetical protein [Deltaproteobacteria bacterium]